MLKKDASLILIILLALCGLYLLLPEGKTHQPESAEYSSQRVGTAVPQHTPNWNKIEKTIDMHMKLGRHSEELRRQLTAVENAMQAPQIDPAKIDPLVYESNEPLPLDSEIESDAARVYRQTIERKRESRSLTPDERISSKISRDQWEREYREAYEREYIKAYLENARKAGYDIRLNEKGEIIDVIKIGQSEPMRFPQAVDNSGEKATSSGEK